MLSGFLAPDGTYTECPSYAHMSTATELMEEYFPEDAAYRDIENEEKLINEKGYVGLYARGASFNNYDHPLTDEQKRFLEDAEPNNDDQKKQIERILEYDKDMHEGSILSRYENKALQ